MVDNQQHKVSSIHYPAWKAMCPLCGQVSEIRKVDLPRGSKWFCSCGQSLDPDIHSPAVIGKRQEMALRRLPEKRLRDFVVTLANLRALHAEDVTGAAELVRRFPEFFPPPYPDDSYWSRARRRFQQGDVPPEVLRLWSLEPLLGLRNDLRHLWEMRDDFERNWFLHGVCERAAAITAHPSVEEDLFRRMLTLHPPPMDGLQQALLYLSAKFHVTRTCRPSCAITPYFIAVKRNQRYCDELCSAAAQSEVKQLWWRTRGAEWRKQQRAEQKKKKKGKTK